MDKAVRMLMNERAQSKQQGEENEMEKSKMAASTTSIEIKESDSNFPTNSNKISTVSAPPAITLPTTGRSLATSRIESQRRWGIATKKVKNILAVSDALNSNKTTKVNERAMSKEQKSHFLDKFSTRDRGFTGGTYDFRPKRIQQIAQQIQQQHLLKPQQNGGLVETTNNNAGQISALETKAEAIQQSKSYDSDMVNFAENDDSPLYDILLEPYSTFNYFWTWIVIIAIQYNSWVIIFRIAFPDSQRHFTALWFTFDYIADFIYFVDILISSRLSFLENGIYVEDVKRVMLNYIKSRTFMVDAISLLPLDLLYLVFSINPAFRLPRMVKFIKVIQGKKLIEAMTNFPNLVRGIFWLYVMFLLIHWNSCFFYLISKVEGFGSNDWVYPKIEGAHQSIIYRYLRCMYWSTLILTTIGEDTTPETNFENVYMIVCYITGIFIFATIVGQAGNVIQNMNASRMEFEKQRDNTMQYMKVHNVPTNLQKRVRLWYDYTYSRGRFNGGDDINEVTMLPDKMKTELALHVHLETLRKVSFLQKCQPEFLHDLVLKMKLHIFTPGDIIIRKGEIAREMYVISDGMAEVVSETGRVLKVLEAGDFFGEIGLLSLSAGQNRRTADVRSCGYIELFVLSKEDVMSSIRDYPDAQRILAKHGKKRLALGSKASSGPRDETTSSGSQSSDNDEEEKDGYSEESPLENNNKTNEVQEEDDGNGEKTLPVNGNCSLSKYNLSPTRGSVYVDLDNRKAPSIQLQLYDSKHGSHGRLVGPASSIKSLERRSFCKKSVIRRRNSKSSVKSEDNGKNSDDALESARIKIMRRAKSAKDMLRKSRRFSRHPDREALSDGENHNIWNVSKSTLKSTSKHQECYNNNDDDEDDDIMIKDLTRVNSTDEDMFMYMIKKLYADNIKSVKKQSQSDAKKLKNRISTMERTHTEESEDKDRKMEELKQELRCVEDQMYQLTKQIAQKEEDHRKKEESWKKKVENLKRQIDKNLDYN